MRFAKHVCQDRINFRLSEQIAWEFLIFALLSAYRPVVGMGLVMKENASRNGRHVGWLLSANFELVSYTMFDPII